MSKYSLYYYEAEVDPCDLEHIQEDLSDRFGFKCFHEISYMTKAERAAAYKAIDKWFSKHNTFEPTDKIVSVGKNYVLHIYMEKIHEDDPEFINCDELHTYKKVTARNELLRFVFEFTPLSEEYIFDNSIVYERAEDLQTFNRMVEADADLV